MPPRRYYTGEETDYIYDDYEGDWGFVLDFSRYEEDHLAKKFRRIIREKASLNPHRHLNDLYYSIVD